jgi:Flp pilus assembly protein TadG
MNAHDNILFQTLQSLRQVSKPSTSIMNARDNHYFFPPGPRDSRRGQALIELAIVLPLLIILVMGAVDLSRAFYAFQAVESAATSGCQYACQSQAHAANTAAVTTNALAQTTNIASLSPTVSVSVNSNVVDVTVSAIFTTVMTWPGVPKQVPLNRTVEMRILK